MKKSGSFSFSQVAAAAASKNKKPSITKSSSHRDIKKNASTTDRSYEKWEMLREKKLESMKISSRPKIIERRLKTDEEALAKYNHQATIQPPQIKPRKPAQPKIARHKENNYVQQQRKASLDPNWYTDNIYQYQSFDDSDSEATNRRMPTSASFPNYTYGRHRSNRNRFHHHPDLNSSNNININISNANHAKFHAHSPYIESDGCDVTSPYFERYQNYPKSQSCNFSERCRDKESELRSRSVPKSHSFSTNRSVRQHYDMDLIEYQRYKRLMDQRYRDHGPPLVSEVVTRICDREGCFSDTCLVKNSSNTSQNININNNIINNNNLNTTKIINDWDVRNKSNTYQDGNDDRKYPRETIIDDVDTFDDDDFIFNDGFSFQEFPCQPIRPSRQPRYRGPHYSSMRFANFSENFNRRNRVYDRDLDELFRRERSKVLIRNRFDKLNKYSEDFMDDYQQSFEDLFMENSIDHHGNNLKPSKAMLEVNPPSRYDDTESDSTDLDLDDFNLDFEKYWEELEDKNLSTTTLDIEGDESVDQYDTNNNQINKNYDPDNSDHYNDQNNNPFYYRNTFSKATIHPEINLKHNDFFQKLLPTKRMNIPSTARPLGEGPCMPHDEYMFSLKRPLTLNNITESPIETSPKTSNSYLQFDESTAKAKFQIIPNKTGLKISPLYNLEFDNFQNSNRNTFNGRFFHKSKNKLKSTSRPLLFW